MKQNKEMFRGTGKVFVFTFTQFVKNRGNLITIMILLILTLFSVPVMTLFSGGGMAPAETSGIKNVYWKNATKDKVNPAETAKELPFFSQVSFTETDFSETEVLKTDETDAVYVEFSEETEHAGIQISIRYPENGKPSEQDLEELKMLLTRTAEKARMETAGITDGLQELLLGEISGQVETSKSYLEGEGTSWDVQYGIQLGYSILVMVISIFSVTYIIRTVVEEKASRLVELLMVSVEPLALIVGKILAAMAYVFGMILTLGVGFGISWTVSRRFLDVSAISDSLSAAGFSMELLKLGPETVLVVMVSLLLGFLTFAILAGLSGSGCSSMEDVQGASTLSTLLIFAGYFLAIVLNSAGTETAAFFGSLCPFVSVFCAPVQFVLGKTGAGTLLLSWGIQVVIIAGLTVFSARIYRALLLYRGNRPDFRQMLRIAGLQSSGKEKK